MNAPPLTYRQQQYLRSVKNDGPGWNRDPITATPTLDALEKRGLIAVRRGPCASFHPERQVLLLDPENPDGRPGPTLREITATEMGNAWRALGFDKYLWKGGDPEPDRAARKRAAAILRLLADELLEPL